MRLVLTLSLLLFSIVSFSQRYATASGAWNGAIWAATENGVAGSAAVPTATDDVYTNGRTVTVTASGATCQNLYISYDVAGTLVLNNLRTVTVTGTLSGYDDLNDTEEFPITNVITFNSGSSLIFTGANVQPSYSPYVIYFWDTSVPLGRATFNFGAGNTRNLIISVDFGTLVRVQSGTLAIDPGATITGSGATLTIDANASIVTDDPIGSFNSIGNSGTITSSSTIAATNLTINSGGVVSTSGSISVTNGTINGTVTTSNFFNASGNFVMGAAGVLNTSYTGGNGWFSGGGPGSIALDPTSTINFSANGAQNIPITTYGNLTLSGSGTKSATGSGSLTFTGNINNSSSSVTFSPTQDVLFSGSAANQNISGTGTINFASGLEIDKSAGTVNVNRAITVSNGITVSSGTLNLGSQTVTLSSGNITNSGTFTSGTSTIVVNGATQINGTVSFHNLTIGASGTFTAPSGTLNISGNLTNNGTSASFLANSGTLVFNGTTDQSISGTLTVNNLTSGSSGTNGLGVSGTVNLLGTFNLSSGLFDADGIGGTSGVFVVRSTGLSTGGRIGTLSSPNNFTGNVTIERYIDSPEDYRYLSIPITNGNLGMWQDDFAITGNFSDATTPAQNPNVIDAAASSVFTFNGGTQSYVAVGSGGTTVSHNLSNTVGYIAWGYNSSDFVLDVTGTIGKGTINLTGLAASQYNLIPNPYPSAIDWDGITSTNFSNSIYLTTAQGAFATYTKGGGFGVNHPDTQWSGQIALGQSFWVESVNGSGTSLSITEAAKTGTYEFVREEVPADYFKIKLVSGTQSDELGIAFREGATLGNDHDFDAIKRSNPPGMINLSSFIDNPSEEFAINVVPLIQCNQTIKLKLSDVSVGQYVFKFSDLDKIQLGYEVTLKDNFLSQSVSVDNAVEFNFEVTSDPLSKADTRFEILVASPEVDPSLEMSLTATQECSDPLVRVEFDTTQPGIQYVLKLGDVNLHEPIKGNGSASFAFVPKSSLNLGVNHLSMVASTLDGCNAQMLSDVVVINLHEVNEITTVTAGQTCGEGSVTLTAGGASSDGSYRWYESINAIEPISSASGSEYSTPVLSENKTYYVTAVNAVGCESFTRTPVEAKVVNLATPIVSAEGYIISTESQGEYQWLKDGVMIDGATTNSYEVKTSGLYSVIVTNTGCQVTSAEMEFIITDVEDNSGRHGFTAYPNPTDGLVNISGDGLDRSEITVYQVDGKRVQTNAPELSPNGQQAKIDLTGSRKGIYLIQIHQNNKIVQLKVFKK
jgi:hypothetical protein